MSTPYMNSLGRKSNGKGTSVISFHCLILLVCYRPSTAGLKKQWCTEIIELIEHMWSQEPQDRPAISEVVGSLEELYARY
jgi:hypothetical protein